MERVEVRVHSHDRIFRSFSCRPCAKRDHHTTAECDVAAGYNSREEYRHLAYPIQSMAAFTRVR